MPPDLFESVLRSNNEHHDSALDTILIDQSVTVVDPVLPKLTPAAK